MKYALLLMIVCSLAFTSSQPAATELETEVLTATNKFRKENKLDSLSMVEAFNELARQHSEAMAKKKLSFGHSGFDKRQKAMMKEIVGLRSFAENVSQGGGNGADFVERWKNSPQHRENLLGKYKYIGIGAATDRNGQIFVTQIFAGN